MITVTNSINYGNIKTGHEIQINIDHIVAFFQDAKEPGDTIIALTKNEWFDDIHCFHTPDELRAMIKIARKERNKK